MTNKKVIVLLLSLLFSFSNLSQAGEAGCRSLFEESRNEIDEGSHKEFIKTDRNFERTKELMAFAVNSELESLFSLMIQMRAEKINDHI